jgi:cystathionine beta-synthase
VKYAQDHNLGQDDLVVVLLPDTGARYLSKVFDDDWMRENGFLHRAWEDVRAIDIQAAKGVDELVTARPTDLMIDVIGLFKQYNISQVPVIDSAGSLCGIATEVDLLNHMLNLDHKHSADETIESIIVSNVPVVRPNTPLETLMGIFSTNSVALITSGDEVQGILTKIDLLDFLSTQVR